MDFFINDRSKVRELHERVDDFVVAALYDEKKERRFIEIRRVVSITKKDIKLQTLNKKVLQTHAVSTVYALDVIVASQTS